MNKPQVLRVECKILQHTNSIPTIWVVEARHLKTFRLRLKRVTSIVARVLDVSRIRFNNIWCSTALVDGPHITRGYLERAMILGAGFETKQEGCWPIATMHGLVV